MNNPPDGQGSGRASHDGSSSNLDYLLEDEEEPKRGGGKLIAVVIALILAGGFGYLRWKQGGFDWLLHDKRPAQSAETRPNGTDSGSTPGASTTPDAGNPGAANPSGVTPAPATPDTGAAPGSGTSGTPAGGETATPAATAPNGAASDAPAPPSSSSPSSGAAKPAEEPAADNPSDSAENKPAGTAAETESPAKSSKAEVSARTKPRERKPTPATPLDPTAEAERYIYGRGVRQDCDHGLRLLKPAAQSNANAMIALGTLYSTGTCTPRDLPTAYRWFALALHKEPDNQGLQSDLQKLWGQMTQPERQLAVKLSQ